MPQVSERRELLTNEAARLARVSVKTIYRWIAEGLPYSRPGGHGHYRIDLSDLERFLRQKGASGVSGALTVVNSESPLPPQSTPQEVAP